MGGPNCYATLDSAPCAYEITGYRILPNLSPPLIIAPPLISSGQAGYDKGKKGNFKQIKVKFHLEIEK